MRKLEHDLAEVAEYLAEFRLMSPPWIDGASKSALKAAYKQFHAILVWDFLVEGQWPRAHPTKLFLREAASDVSHCCLLVMSGFYKNARMSLRSAIENVIKVLLLDKSVSVGKINSVYGLFLEARRIYAHDELMVTRINSIDVIYAELCKTVHSTRVDYMSLAVPFENLNRFDRAQFLKGLELLENVCRVTNHLFFIMWAYRLKAVGHTNEDMVRDSLPKNLKRQVQNRY